jgi:magnesium transporter
MSEVMKVLTVIATIFIPLSFIAGLYGMNFDRQASAWNMPELHWRFGYPFALGLMAAVAGGLLWFFWRRRWIGR